MSKAPSTRDRILSTSLALFNARGERNVTTNHLAAELCISPGNLYYHFRNKGDIIASLYERHRAQMVALLGLPEGRAFTMADKALLLERLAEALWQYRFFYRDTEHILSEAPELAARHKQTFSELFQRTLQLQQALAEAGLIRADAQAQRDLAYNAWIILSSWINFLRTDLQVAMDEQSGPALIRRGVYQVLSLEKAYMTELALAQLGDLETRYYLDLTPYLEATAPCA